VPEASDPSGGHLNGRAVNAMSSVISARPRSFAAVAPTSAVSSFFAGALSQ
jgi:hypothetical protein